MIAIPRRIAQELKVDERQVAAAVELLDAGSTVPFIARYRKEATGALDDTQLRNLEERLRYLRELEDRAQGHSRFGEVAGQADAGTGDGGSRRGLQGEARRHLSALQAQAPHQGDHRPRGRASARSPPICSPTPCAIRASEAEKFVDEEKGVKTPEEALEGARAILVEQFSEKAELIGVLRENFWSRGRIVSKVRDGKAQEGAKYRRLFRFLRAAAQTAVPSHPRAVSRREGGDSRSRAGAGKRRRGRGPGRSGL